MLFNQVSSASKLLEQMQQTSSDCDHDNSATELQRIHVVTDIETNFTIGANGLSSPEHNTAFEGPALQVPESPEPSLWAPLSPDPYSPAPPSPEVPLPSQTSPVPNHR